MANNEIKLFEWQLSFIIRQKEKTTIVNNIREKTTQWKVQETIDLNESRKITIEEKLLIKATPVSVSLWPAIGRIK